jgi:hypothetical protein
MTPRAVCLRMLPMLPMLPLIHWSEYFSGNKSSVRCSDQPTAEASPRLRQGGSVAFAALWVRDSVHPSYLAFPLQAGGRP